MTESRAERARRLRALADAEGSSIQAALDPAPPPPIAPPPARPETPPPAPSPTPPPSTKERTVRYTIDLDESLHRRLKLVALDNRVRAAEVFRAALEGHTDEELANLIAARRRTAKS